jgi:ribosomal protein S18 acetylase RimI-like enzyme
MWARESGDRVQEGLIIRPMAAVDVPAVMGLLNDTASQLAIRLGPGHWDQAVTRERMDNSARERETFVVSLSGIAVATVAVSMTAQKFWPRRCWERPGAPALCVYALAVAPHYQRRGVGAWTMRAVEAMAQQRGLVYVRLDAYAQDSRSNAFYRSLGYKLRATVTVNSVPLNCFEKLVAIV